MSALKADDPRIQAIQSSIRVVPNFPKPGIMFQDITTLLLDPKVFRDTIDLFVERYTSKNISVVAAAMDREYNGVIYRPQLPKDEELDNFLSFGKGLRPDLNQRKKDDKFDLEMQAVRPQGITRRQALDILNNSSHLMEKSRDTDVLGHYQSKHTDLWERCFVLRWDVKWVLRLTCERVKSDGDLVSVLMNM